VTQNVAGVKIKVGGSDLDPAIASSIQETHVESNLVLPDMFTIRLNDPGMKRIDSHPFEIGKQVEIAMEAAAGSTPKTIFKGEVTSLEPEFMQKKGVTITVRGYDPSNRLHRSRLTKTYQNSTFGDIAKKVISAAGLSAGTVDDAGGTQDFVQQSSETPWEFLWRLARRIDNEVVADGEKIHFRKAGGPNGGPIDLDWGGKLLSFRPRATAGQQVQSVEVRAWDHKTKQAITSTKQQPKLSSKIGIHREQVMKDGLAGAKLVIGQMAGTTQAEVDALAQSVISRLGDSYTDAHGVAQGNPDLKAGVKVNIKGVGQKFSGTYTLTSAEHVFKGGGGSGGGGYTTKFTISGRASHSLVDLMAGRGDKQWASSVVIGIVTNNQDPDNLGRVRVKYPSLSNEDEGWWARIASTAAGKDRGVLMLPQKDDEVLIAFEHDDPRKPYVLGSVWNAKDTPGDLVEQKGSFVLQSDQKINMKAKQDIAVKGDQNFKLETTGNQTAKAQGDFKQESKSIDMKASTSASIKGGSTVTIHSDGSVTVEGNSSVTVKASGSLTLQGSTVSISGGSISIG
jgi:uncharacterized protein involved in type VI secretion and phage assembly